MLIWQNAELKVSVSRKEFLKLYQLLLERDKTELSIEMKEQIVYFADNVSLDFYQKKHLAVRYRWNNRGLEIVVKKRWIPKDEFGKFERLYADTPNHELKLDIDQVGQKSKTYSCVLKTTMNSVHQSFAFYNTPYELLSDAQRDFLSRCIKTDLKELRFLIPIQSKTFLFPTDFKEFEMIALEERRMPKLFWGKFYEITAKTPFYQKKTVEHFAALCEKFDITLHDLSIYKTEWLYNAYFNV